MQQYKQGALHIQLTITTQSPGETFALGQALGEIVSNGTVVAMTGVLGSGKTLFVQGMARGLEVPESCYVTSPSYTLVNEYPGRCRLYHADLYRLTQSDDVESTGLYDMLHKDGVVVIEWAERMVPEELAEQVSLVRSKVRS